jgi:hypothetical protein
MTFSDKNWEQRETVLGDPAEHAFETFAKNTNLRIVRYGLNRPPINMFRVPVQIRYTPDYLTDHGLVEVQGCGTDETFKFKHDKLWAISQWKKMDDMWWFLWNQPLDQHVIASHQLIVRLASDVNGISYRVDGHFDEIKPFAKIPWGRLWAATR